jgi:hypothetical protein
MRRGGMRVAQSYRFIDLIKSVKSGQYTSMQGKIRFTKVPVIRKAQREGRVMFQNTM